MDGKKKRNSIASDDKFFPSLPSKAESKVSKFGLGKLKRRSSYGKDKRKSEFDNKTKSKESNIPALTITIQRKESVPESEYLETPPKPLSKQPLSKSISKSEDSLDSGIYSRQKSCDSMDSVGSSNPDQHSHCTSFATATGGGMSPTEENTQRVGDNDYDIYWREVHSINETESTASDYANEPKQRPVGLIRSDSVDEDDDHEAAWLMEAGLADLVTTSSPTNSSSKVSTDRSSQISTESLSSMTVLSTLTRPQRAAVLRRIESFNRAQQTRRQPRPHIKAVFPNATTPTDSTDRPPTVPKAKTPDSETPIIKTPPLLDREKSTSKSSSLPHGMTGIEDMYSRRYSEVHRPTNLSRLPGSDEALTSSSHSGHVMTVGNKSHIKKEDMDSIVAAGNSTATQQKSFTEEYDYPEVFFSPTSSSNHYFNFFDKSSARLTHLSYPPSKHKSKIRRRRSSLESKEPSSLILLTETTNTKPSKVLTNEKLRNTIQMQPPRITSFLHKSKSQETVASTLGNSPAKKIITAVPVSPAFIAFTSALGQQQLQEQVTNSHNLSPFKALKYSYAATPSKSSHAPKWSPRRTSIKESFIRVTDSLLPSPHRSGSYKLHQPHRQRGNLQRAASLYSNRRPSSETDDIIATDEDQMLFLSPRIESLSIRSRSTDDNSRWSNSDTSVLHLSDSEKPKVKGYSETADQANLPNFSLVKDRLGITRISDLSAPDVRKVQSLAWIELTALFDLHGIELKRRKFGKTKVKDSGTFGVPLTTLLELDQKRQNNPNLKVAYILQEIVVFLEENGLTDEGILRVPGSSVRIKNLKQELEDRYNKTIKFLDPDSGWGSARTNDVAALLKQFLRDLPNPLLSAEYIDAFMSCELIPDRKQQLQALNLLILLLETTHRDALKLLLKFLSKVVLHEEVNKMSLNNVAMIMAPNLFMGRKSSKRDVPSVLTASQDVKHAAGTSNIVRMLIKYHKLLWTVPTFMLTQVRNMNQAENSSKKQHGQSKDKPRYKFLPGISSKNKEPIKKPVPSSPAQQAFDYEVPKGVIRVQILNHPMTSMAVQVNSHTTAAEVIAKITRQCEKAREMSPESNITLITEETHALYEVGGNINERCLDPGTNMNMLTKVNPDATWVIKLRPTH